MQNLLNRIRRAASEFVRKHIVDDEENIWPNLTAWERHELESERPREVRKTA